jgi:HEAT repeat protein
MRKATALSLTFVVAAMAGGCATNPYPPGSPAAANLKQRALASLRQGVQYEAAAVVRSQAIEAMKLVAPQTGLPWMRNALRDESPLVRFAACVALGELQDTASRSRMTELLNDPNTSVQLAAIFALHRVGDVSHSHRIAEVLLYGKDPGARRNAAMLLGRLGEPGAVTLLARVAESPDEGLRLQALEAMALLGSSEAKQQLQFLAHSGLGAREAFVVTALGNTRNDDFATMYRYKLKTAIHPETRLAAARALGQLGSVEGLDLAVREVHFNQPDRSEEVATEDAPEAQIVRVRSLAALALGEMGDPAALPPLVNVLDDPYDPRVELAAALAIVQILDRESATDGRRS